MRVAQGRAPAADPQERAEGRVPSRIKYLGSLAISIEDRLMRGLFRIRSFPYRRGGIPPLRLWWHRAEHLSSKDLLVCAPFRGVPYSLDKFAACERAAWENAGRTRAAAAGRAGIAHGVSHGQRARAGGG